MTEEKRGERGSAVIAALLASACFALLAMQVARTSRSAIVSANAGLVHARLAEAAEAGLMIAVEDLSADPSSRWALDGQEHVVDFGDASLTISVEDERGKIPLNFINGTQLRTLFEKGGADPASIEDLVSAFLDMRDPNREHARQTNGSGVAPRNTFGGFRTVQDLASVPGMTSELYDAIAPSATVSAGDRAFDPRTASPLALAVMSNGSANSPEMIERLRELAGQRTALNTEPPIDPIGRALTIKVKAEDGRNSRLERDTIVELTGQPQRPYLVRLRPA